MIKSISEAINKRIHITLYSGQVEIYNTLQEYWYTRLNIKVTKDE